MISRKRRQQIADRVYVFLMKALLFSAIFYIGLILFGKVI